ncbi:hypothetical protein MLD38_005475 [Melastoma candidum]|uniref:Uncharacterized protein n=1 Tax=Melastoma candidum TaxID=119954 RepID=A0ACB9RJH6_9MYRT|nr:hypothetical protein MLD38_005475 [Melastoma candidum]
MARCCPLLFLIVLLPSVLEAGAVVKKGSYEGCGVARCSDGGPSISYPFYLSGKDYCGYPGFEINCTEDGTTSFEGYVVQSISYVDQLIHVINEDAVQGFCTRKEPKWLPLTFESAFIIQRTNFQLCFYNCTNSKNLPKSFKGCPSNHSFVTLTQHPEQTWDNKTSQCMLSGIIPVDLREGDRNKSVETLDYKSLLENGITLDWSSLLAFSSCKECHQSGGRCGQSDSSDLACFCPDGTSHGDNCNQGTRWRWRKVEHGIAAGGVLIALSIIGTVTYCIRKKSWPVARRKQNGSSWPKDVDVLMRSNGLPVWPRRYKYRDLKKLTNAFSDKLGEGGYGKVYKGKLREEDNFVAVKILKECKGDGEEFVNEVASIGRTAHVNIVRLLGFCYEGNKRALIYEYMPNGSLDKFLPLPTKVSPDCPLDWETLHRIALGVARGLEYLHRGCNTRILHFDIKPQNILLDSDFTPKISDFGLARLCKGGESIVSMIGARGTIGYIAPEVVSRCFGSVSNKSDVYSYGMLVFEMIGGKNKSSVEASRSSEVYFPEWVYNHLESGRALWMPGIYTEEDEGMARKMMLVSLWCIQPNPSGRPSMSRVIEMLEGSVQMMEVPPKPFLKSPPRPSPEACRATASTTWSF